MPRKKPAPARHQAAQNETGLMIQHAAALLQAGRRAECLACLCEADARNVSSHLACNLAGLVALALGENERALEWFGRALALVPGQPDVLANRGVALQQLGRAAEALAAYGKAVETGCAKPEVFYNRGNLLRAAGRLGDALASYEEAFRLNPAYAEALRAAALVLRDLGRREKALELLEEAVRQRPGFADALNDRGNVLQELERFEEALLAYNAALGVVPRRADILSNRGSTWLALGQCQNAGDDFRAALQIDPAIAEAWSNLGNLLLTQLSPDAALEAYDKALALRPSYAEALCGRAVALKYLCRFEEALAGFDKAIALDAASPHIKNNKGALLLLQGNFEQGLDLYEFRWSNAGTAKDLAKFDAPLWNGEDISGRSITVLDEQGHGDAIQFARYLPLLAARGAHVTFFCRRHLHRLFRCLGPSIRIMDTLAGEARFDFQIALSSLPRAFAARLESIPAPPSYFCAEPALVQKWRGWLGPDGFKAGICWRGNPNPKADPSRSIPLACFAKFSAIENVRLVSLQKQEGRAAQETLEGLILPGKDFDSGPDAFVDTAALMQSLDLVITCDTSIAHLAGALGQPVWVLLKDVPDWRWLLGREDSPWYPAMRLFRQRRRGAWGEVFERAAQALQALQGSPRSTLTR